MVKARFQKIHNMLVKMLTDQHHMTSWTEAILENMTKADSQKQELVLIERVGTAAT